MKPLREVEVYLSLGSNLNDREGALHGAAEALRGCLNGVRISRLYETDPLYNTRQPKFLNLVLSGWTRVPARRLLARIHGIERAMGRSREQETDKGPRTLDIDVLLYGQQVLGGRDLILPHPGMEEREFVLVPLLELADDLRHPRTGLRFRHYLRHLRRQGVYSYESCHYNWEHLLGSKE